MAVKDMNYGLDINPRSHALPPHPGPQTRVMSNRKIPVLVLQMVCK